MHPNKAKNLILFQIVIAISLILFRGQATASEHEPELTPTDRQRLEQLELEVLKLQAAAPGNQEEAKDLELKPFVGGQRSLQALNPELSVVGDLFARYLRSPEGRDSIGDEHSGGFLRVLGLHLQSNLDPFSFARLAVELGPEGAEVGEAYLTWTSLLPGLSLTAGKFRQQLGVVNRWHKPSLDQFDFPLMLLVPFGPEGLNQTGISLNATLPPLWSHGLELYLEVTNGSNSGVFAGEFFSLPAELVRVSSFWDLSSSTYLELGLTGMLGFNNRRNVPVYQATVAPGSLAGSTGLGGLSSLEATGSLGGLSTATPTYVSEDWRTTIIGGADLTLNWEPLSRAKYHYFTWRSEFLYIRKQLSPDGVDKLLTWMGGYSYLEYKLDRSWVIGVRGDLAQPFELNNDSRWDWQAVPYLTWWQSPWVRLRLEYDYLVPDATDPEHRVFLQVTFAAGPHKHERY